MNHDTFRAFLVSGSARISGVVHCQNRKIFFREDKASEIYLEWDEFSVTASIERGIVKIHSSVNSNQSIEVSNPAFARVLLSELGIETVSSMQHWWLRRSLLHGVLTTFALLIAFVVAIGILRTQGRIFANFVSHAQEVELGKRAMLSEMPKAIDLPQDLRATWEQLTARILQLPALGAYEWHVHVIREKTENAFALPGGTLAFTSALILKSQSPEELLGILAHEAAHVTERHGINNLAGETSVSVLLSLLFSGSTNMFGSLVSVANRLESLSFSRAQEADADEVGISYLKSARVSSKGLLGFFLRSRESSGSSGVFKWISTHPMDTERMNRIHALAGEYDTEPVNLDLAPLRKFLENAN